MTFMINCAVIFGMIMAQLILAMITLLYKYIAERNFELRDMVAYSLIIATIFLVPSAVVFERRKNPLERSKLTWKVIGLGFICGLLGGTISYNAFVGSLKMVSSTTAMAILNLSPAITFVMAILFRLENLGLQTWVGKFKITGTLIAISGSMILSFCKGHVIQIWHSSIQFQHNDRAESDHTLLLPNTLHREIIGFCLAIVSCVTASTASIIQAKIMVLFPDQLSTSALIIANSAIQCLLVMVVRDHKLPDLWVFRLNVNIAIILFAGVLGSGLTTVLTSWCMKKKGPFFVSIFGPVSLFAVAFSSPLILDEKLYIGSILGAIVIVSGVYLVIWGKSNEEPNQSLLDDQVV